MTEYLHTKNKK